MSFEKKIAEMRAKRAATVDGVLRPDRVEQEIDEAFRRVFRGPDGQFVLDYLKSITINMVLPPGCADALLREHEGARRLVGVIDARARSKPKE